MGLLRHKLASFPLGIFYAWFWSHSGCFTSSLLAHQQNRVWLCTVSNNSRKEKGVSWPPAGTVGQVGDCCFPSVEVIPGEGTTVGLCASLDKCLTHLSPRSPCRQVLGEAPLVRLTNICPLRIRKFGKGVLLVSPCVDSDRLVRAI